MEQLNLKLAIWVEELVLLVIVSVCFRNLIYLIYLCCHLSQIHLLWNVPTLVTPRQLVAGIILVFARQDQPSCGYRHKHIIIYFDTFVYIRMMPCHDLVAHGSFI